MVLFLSVNKIIGNKLHIKPKKSKPQIKPETDLYILYLDPGLAFGSGEHPTTELCLEWLTDQQLRGKNALDYGCGSGILGIAASLLGARSVCVDYDQQALVATEQNAAFNEVTKNDFTVMHSSKLGLEDHAAASCATQNFMLSLASEGIGSKWMTGALGAPPEDVLAAVGAGEGERLMGAIWYGYPAKELSNDAKAPPRKKGVEGVLTQCP